MYSQTMSDCSGGCEDFRKEALQGTFGRRLFDLGPDMGAEVFKARIRIRCCRCSGKAFKQLPHLRQCLPQESLHSMYMLTLMRISAVGTRP